MGQCTSANLRSIMHTILRVKALIPYPKKRGLNRHSRYAALENGNRQVTRQNTKAIYALEKWASGPGGILEKGLYDLSFDAGFYTWNSNLRV